MADKNQLKIADQVDLADDDPFAELTRIMGFDPRQPAKQAGAQQQAPAPVEQVAEEDDFSLDLEKELLGGFDLEDEIADENSPAEAARPYEAPALPSRMLPKCEAPDVDFDFSADFDAAMAASGETEAQAEPEALGEPEAEFDLGLTDLGLTDDDLRALDLEASQSGEQAATEPETTEWGPSSLRATSISASPMTICVRSIRRRLSPSRQGDRIRGRRA